MVWYGNGDSIEEAHHIVAETPHAAAMIYVKRRGWEGSDVHVRQLYVEETIFDSRETWVPA